MSKNIKGLNVEIGADTQPLSKALGDVNKNTRDLQKELRDVERLLKFNPGNTELISQQQKVLGETVDSTKEKLNGLKEAEKQVQEQFEKGEISEEQYRAFQREIVETESKLNHYEKKLKDVSDTQTGFGKSLDNAGKNMKAMGDKAVDAGKGLTKKITAPAIAAGGAIFALARKSGDAADRLLDLSDITGMSTDSIQEWQHVATVAGVSTETMTSAVEGLVRRIPQLESEGGKATEGLDKLGLEFKDLKKLSPDEQFDEIIYSLSGMEDPLERNAIGSQLFGGAWKDLAPILGMGAEEIANTRNEAHELGNVLSEDSLNDANDFRIEMDKMKETIANTALQIGADLAPILKDSLVPIIRDTVIPAIQGFVEKISGLIEWYQGLSDGTKSMIKIIAGIAVAIGPILIILGKLAAGIGAIMSAASVLIPVIAAIASPVGIVIAAIVALIAIGVALYKNWDKVKEEAKKIGPAIVNAVKNIPKQMLEIGKNIIGGLISGITNGISKLKDVVGNIGSTIKDGITGFFKIKSPSKVTEQQGEFIGEGLAKGMRNSLKGIEKETLAMGKVVTERNHILGGSMDINISGDGASNLNDERFARAVEQRIVNNISDDNRRLPDKPKIIPL